MIPVNLKPDAVKELLAGKTRITVELHRPMKVGTQVWAREAWRGWNSAGEDRLSDGFAETARKAQEVLAKFTAPEIINSREYREAMKSFEAVRKPSGWAEIDYRTDMKRVRITGLTTEQSNQARVVGQIDIGLTKDPWRAASLMPQWASRFKLCVVDVRRTGSTFRIRLQKEE